MLLGTSFGTPCGMPCGKRSDPERRSVVQPKENGSMQSLSKEIEHDVRDTAWIAVWTEGGSVIRDAGRVPGIEPEGSLWSSLWMGIREEVWETRGGAVRRATERAVRRR